MISITITGCIFSNNQAYQSYAIYIKGENCDTTFTINDHNQFNNNYHNEESGKDGGIISSEITTISKEEIETSNEFSNDENHGPNSKSFIHVDYTGHPLPDQTPEPLPDEIIVAPSDTTDNRYENNNKDETKTSLITINVTNFTNIDHTGNGGAIHITDFGLKCEQLTFENCSTSEAGGAVYVKNNRDLDKNITLNGLNFNECKTEYGGAVYIYSESTTTFVRISKCLFTKNTASLIQKDDELFDGSAIYLTAMRATIVKCKMSKNNGSSVKIINNFDKSPDEGSLLLLGNNYLFVHVYKCEFIDNDDDDLSSSSFFYLRGKNGVRTELVECLFNEKLSPGAYYINGMTTSESGHKLNVLNCIFNDSKEKSFNHVKKNSLKSNGIVSSYVSVDFNNQVFRVNNNASKERNNKVLFSTKMMVLTVSCTVSIIFALTVFILNKKKRTVQKDQEDNHSIENDI